MQTNRVPKQHPIERRHNGAKGVIKPPPKEKELIPTPREQEWEKAGLHGRLDTLPEGEVTAGGVREVLPVPGPTAPVDRDADLRQGGLDGEGFRQPGADEGSESDNGLELLLASPFHDGGR